MSTQPINGREAAEESRETPDHRDFLKVARTQGGDGAGRDGHCERHDDPHA